MLVKDDVLLHRFEALVVEAHRLQGLGWQVGHDHVCRRHELARDLRPLRLHRVERQAALVAADLKEEGPHPVGSDRRHEAIFSAIDALDADHLRAQVSSRAAQNGPAM